MAYRCFKLAVTANNDHAEAYNNIGVLEWRRGRGEQVRGAAGRVWPVARFVRGVTRLGLGEGLHFDLVVHFDLVGELCCLLPN